MRLIIQQISSFLTIAFTVSMPYWTYALNDDGSHHVSELPAGIEVDFCATNEEGLVVLFENTSTNPDIVFEWDLGDGHTICEQSFDYTYQDLGHYYVCMYIKDAVSSEVIFNTCKYVSVGDVNLCEFDWDPVCGCDNRTYANACIAETYHGMYFWTQGVCSNETAPVLIPEYTYSVEKRQIHFINASTGSYDRFEWDFGDGRSSRRRNPSHTYKKDGPYEICLTVSHSATAKKEKICEKVEVPATKLDAQASK